MRTTSRWSSMVLCCGAIALTTLGCGSRQEQQTTPEVEAPPPPPEDYLGRTAYLLREDGIDLGEIACNQGVIWADHLREDSQAFTRDLEAYIAPLMRRRIRDADLEMAREQIADLAMNWFIRALIVHGDQNNLGAVVIPQVQWTDDAGHEHPLIVFHSGTTPYAEEDDSCFRSLLRHGRVHHVINLYDGNVPLRDLLDAEARVAQELGATYVDTSQGELTYRGWRDIASNAEASDEERATAVERITALIREQILAPGGAPPAGNVYFHCAGGIHRSPVIAGILRRCIAHESDEQVREAMQHHAAYVSEDDPGGWEQPLLDFVESYDCSLLQPERADEAGGDEAPAEAGDHGDGDGDDGDGAEAATPEPDADEE